MRYLERLRVEWCQNRTNMLFGIDCSLAATRLAKPYRFLRELLKDE